MQPSIELPAFLAQIKAVDLPAPYLEGISGTVITQDDLKKGLTFRIPYFEGMLPGGQFLAYLETWDYIFFKPVIVDADSQAAVYFDLQDTQWLLGYEVSIRYIYTGTTQPSPTVAYDAGIRDAPAEIEQADFDRLPVAAIAQELTVKIKPWEGMASGDVCSVYAYGQAPAGVWVTHRPIDSTEVGQELVFNIPAGTFTVHQYGWVHVCYSVLSLGQERWGPRSTYVAESTFAPLGVNEWPPHFQVRPETLDINPESDIKFTFPPSTSLNVGDSILIILSTVRFINGTSQAPSVPKPTRWYSCVRHAVTADNINDPVLISRPAQANELREKLFYAKAIVEPAAGGVTSSPVVVTSYNI